VIIDPRPHSRSRHGRPGLAFLAVAALLVVGLGWLALTAHQASVAGREADIHRRWVVAQFVRQGANPYPLALEALHRVHGPLGGAQKPRVYAIPRPTESERSGEAPHVGAAAAPVIARLGLPEAVYPPSADLLLAWTIGPLPQTAVHLVWLLINLALLGGLAYLVWRSEVPASARTAPAAAAVTALLLLWSPTQATVLTGQFSLLVAVCVLLAVRWLDEHEVAAGAALGLALIKPSLALPFLILPLVRRRWLCLAVAAGSHIAGTCVQAVVFGSAPWELIRQWAAVAAYFAQGQFTIQEVLGALHIVDTPAGTALVAWFVLFAAGWCWAHRAAPDDALVDLLCFVSVLWSYHGPYDFVILFVPLVRRMSAATLPGRKLIPLLALATFVCLSLALSPAVYTDEAHLVSRLLRHATRLLLVSWFAGLLLEVARAARSKPVTRGATPIQPFHFALEESDPQGELAVAAASAPQGSRTIGPASQTVGEVHVRRAG
jgi:hypothetical protein